MIVVTGGAGFIGSAVVWDLNQRGEDSILIVDHLGESEKWKNLVSLRFDDYMDKQAFITKLEQGNFGNSLKAIIHLGACSSTTEKDAGYLMENNYIYTARLAQWHEGKRDCRFIYASSAATYGNGNQGYRDDEDALDTLQPLNMYGYSKQLFDKLAKRRGWLSRCVGLKYFNVYGPNEYHKGSMRSVINKAYPQIQDQGTISLFKSYRDAYKDGEQQRDFIYVKDAVAMTLFFLGRDDVNGIYNIGTGAARSWNDVATAMFTAANKKTTIQYIEMPKELQGKYQYYTCADMTKLEAAGCSHVCRSLEESVGEYIKEYLAVDEYLR